MAYLNGKQILFPSKLVISADSDTAYKYGQSSVLESSKILRGAASGEVIALDNISPFEHIVTVKVSGVDDLTTVKVQQFGKNLCEIGDVGFNSYQNYYLKYPLKGGITYTLSALVESDAYSDYCLAAFYNAESGEICCDPIRVYKNDSSQSVEFTPKYDVTRLILYASSSHVASEVYYSSWKDIMITPRVNDDGYVPFREPEVYPVNADGTVYGISLCHNMTLTTDTNGAIINCNYYKDIDKTFKELTSVT